MKVSIIIPVYSVELYIERCIRSILNQTYRNLEVILVDDCSPDRSMELAERCISDNKDANDLRFVFLKHAKNRGLSAARNTGIDAATGEYIYFLDSDDEITPDCIEKLVAPLSDEKFDFVIGNYISKGRKKDLPKLKLEGFSNDVAKAYEQQLWYAMAVNKLINLQFLRENDLYFMEGQLNEDEIWTFQLAFAAKSMYGVKEPLYIYWLHGNSIMSDVTNEQFIQSRFRISKHMWNYMDSHGLSYNPIANHKVEQILQSGHFIYVLSKKMEGYKYYKQIRQMNHRDRKIYRSLSFSSFSGFVKYSHYLMPVPIGFAFKVLMRLPVILKQQIKGT